MPTDLPSPSVEGGEPTWECGSELDGYRCSRPIGHKGMHRKRSMLGPTQEALHAAYDAGARASEQAAPPLDVRGILREAAKHIEHLIEYAEPSWRAYGAKEWLRDLPARLGSSPSRSDPEPRTDAS